MKRLSLLAFICGLAAPSAVWADEQSTPLAAEGDWVTMAHSVSETAPPDVCVAGAPSAGFGIRIDDSGSIEFRLSNNSWSLPSNVTGNIAIAVAGHRYSFDISANTSNSIAASITVDQLMPVVADMEAANSMTVKAGSDAPLQVPLDGSTTALTALLTCGGIQAPNSKSSGSNPFATNN